MYSNLYKVICRCGSETQGFETSTASTQIKDKESHRFAAVPSHRQSNPPQSNTSTGMVKWSAIHRRIHNRQWRDSHQQITSMFKP
mmetsp:Transcript_20754/g.35492  ORF Transcript_20754/g.35492 Transcript_20754/m.35492 type:complete len:85 (-) Transcript_20754:127-381(-)